MTVEEKKKKHNENQKRYYQKNSEVIKEKEKVKRPDRRILWISKRIHKNKGR